MRDNTLLFAPMVLPWLVVLGMSLAERGCVVHAGGNVISIGLGPEDAGVTDGR